MPPRGALPPWPGMPALAELRELLEEVAEAGCPRASAGAAALVLAGGGDIGELHLRR